MLTTKNSEWLPEIIAGWRPYCGGLAHRWVCLSAGSKVRSFGQWAPDNRAALPTANASG